MISFPSIGQFRTAIADVTGHTRQCDEDSDEELRVLNFIGTVKLHGTNAGIGYQRSLGHWCQSRNMMITPTKDNVGFAQYMDSLADQFFAECVLPHCPIIRKNYEQGKTIVIFGEWCGGNIQANVAIVGLPKMFVIFKVRVVARKTKIVANGTDGDNNQNDKMNSFWVAPEEWSMIKWHDRSIYNICDFPTFAIEIDFKQPEFSQKQLADITEQVEKQCPVGEYFKRIGIGEGVVWTEWAQTHGDLTFKVKGREHCATKARKLAAIHTEKFTTIQDFVEYTCTKNRMRQALDYLREQQLAIEMKNLRIFIKWLLADIVKEEKDTMNESTIDTKVVGHVISNKARAWFNQQL